MAARRLLISYAHPDDESFGLGGLISKYVAEGVEVYLICATNGDVGTIPEDMMNGYNSVAEIRLAELDCAIEKLGFKEVYKLGFKDSGMMNDDTINDPDCLWYKWNHTPEEVTRRVVEVIREVQPHVVITFNRYGGYGHPDHIAIQRATVEAFNLAADESYETNGTPPYQPNKLYYTSLPRRILQMGIWIARLRGKNPRKLGTNQDIDMTEIMNYIEPAHARVNIGDYLEAWDEASACHTSQGGGRISQYPMWLRRLFFAKQTFTRIYPAPQHDVVDEDDLFANVAIR